MSPHGGCSNHGCEAIVRSTIDMLQFPKENVYLYSTDVENDAFFGLNNICTLVGNNSASISISDYRKKIFALREHLFGIDRNTQEVLYRNKMIFQNHKKGIWLSIGGDNYCYYGMKHVLSEQAELFKTKKVPSVLWGCSVEKNSLDGKVIEEIKDYSLIIVRESISYRVLLEIGVDERKLVICSDPAFTLKKQETYWNRDFFSTNPIGINVSDLVKNHYDAYENATYNNFRLLIKYLLEKTDNNIVLIPHVRQKGNDDLIPSVQLANEFKNERIMVVNENFNCMQLKDIISKCSLFIGCRTHSTIAAYSTCVPTLVVGYSTKAKGIAKDIFGDYKDLLVDVREFNSDNDLLNMYLSFYERKDELKAHLLKFMPEYINRAYLAKDALLKLF